MIRIALVQMSSKNNLDVNLRKMKVWLEEASKKGAMLVMFPEMAYFMGTEEHGRPMLAKYEQLAEEFQGWARQFGVYLMPGTLREPVRGTLDRYFNTQLVIDPKGGVIAKYRKLFLFQAKLPDRVYDEGKFCERGNMIVTCDEVPGAHLGMSICFDLRFPELFRALKRRGTQLACLPAAFTSITGAIHWAPLLKARAIENQFFIAAPAQTGTVGEGKETHGDSLVVSPWGEVLLDMGRPEGVGICDIDTKRIEDCERQVAAWSSIREDILPIS